MMTPTDDCFDKLISALQAVDNLNANLGNGRLLETSIYEEGFEAQWLSPRFPGYPSQTGVHPAEAPSQVQLLDIALLLRNLLEKSTHKVATLRGIAMYTQGQSTNFCISASFPSEELKTVYEYLREAGCCKI